MNGKKPCEKLRFARLYAAPKEEIPGYHLFRGKGQKTPVHGKLCGSPPGGARKQIANESRSNWENSIDNSSGGMPHTAEQVNYNK